MKTELISFYTDIDNRTYYSDHANRLQENCQTLNIPIDIIKLESQGDYRLNCLAKPKFILEMMQKKQKPVVWMDVDSIIHEELTVFDTVETYDIGFAAVHNNIKASPIYLNYNPLVLEFIQNWIDDCDTIEEAWNNALLTMRTERNMNRTHPLKKMMSEEKKMQNKERIANRIHKR